MSLATFILLGWFGAICVSLALWLIGFRRGEHSGRFAHRAVGVTTRARSAEPVTGSFGL